MRRLEAMCPTGNALQQLLKGLFLGMALSLQFQVFGNNPMTSSSQRQTSSITTKSPAYNFSNEASVRLFVRHEQWHAQEWLGYCDETLTNETTMVYDHSGVQDAPRQKWIYPWIFWEQQGVLRYSKRRIKGNNIPNNTSVLCRSMQQHVDMVESEYMTLGPPETAVVYYHLHKVGGTTMLNSHYKFNKTKLLQRARFPNFPKDARVLVERIEATKGRSTLFTFLRDPVTRFISGVGQILQMHHRKVLTPCHYHAVDSIELLHCILDKIEGKVGKYDNATKTIKTKYTHQLKGEYFNFLNTHLIPQSVEILAATQGNRDISIMVMPLHDIGKFLKGCAEGPVKQLRSVTNSSAGPQPAAPASSSTESAKKYYSMDAKSVLTPELIERICKVYHWDVALMRGLDGMVPTLCDNPVDTSTKT